MRVVLDTNVLVSGLLYPGGPPSRIVAAWRNDAFELVASDFLLEELQRIFQHLAPRLKKVGFEAADFLDALCLRAHGVHLDAALLACAAEAGVRDPNDVPVLAMLIGSEADWLVTGDKDLLALAEVYPILSPAAFEGRFLG